MIVRARRIFIGNKIITINLMGGVNKDVITVQFLYYLCWKIVYFV